MKFELDDYNGNISDNLLIENLRSVAKKLGKTSVTVEEYKSNGKYSHDPYYRRFGSWLNALEKAGLQKTKYQNIPEEDLFKNLKEVWIKLGRQPRCKEVQRPLSKYNFQTYQKRFSTWRKALEKFVAYINNEENISSEEGIRNLEIEPSTRHKTKRNINWRLRFIVMKRDNFKCKCGRSPATDPTVILNVDHIKAWTNGGETVLENLQTLCSKCNIGKSDLE